MAVTAVKLMSNNEGSFAVDTEHRYTVVWRAYSDNCSDTAFDVAASSLLSQLGSVYTGWTRNSTTGLYTANVSPKDPDSVCVFVSPQRNADLPCVWDVTFNYEGINDPTAVPPEINYDDVPYQEASIQDIYGLVKTNSALELYEEGTDVDKNRTRLTIVRNIPYRAWDPDKYEPFKNSLNLYPFQHGGLVRSVTNPLYDPFDDSSPLFIDVPIVAPRLTAKLTTITARRMVRLKNPNPLNGKYYWQVKAVIDFDYRTYIDNNGNRSPRLWRNVLVDAGYSERNNAGQLIKINYANGFGGNGPQLLDGSGKRLAMVPTSGGTANPPPLPYVAGIGIDLKPIPNHDLYACRSGQTLRINAPGVLANDYQQTADTVVSSVSALHAGSGTLTLDTDMRGGFTYTPSGSFVGWDWFTYKATTPGIGESANAATVAILVGPVPRVRLFDDYYPKDWEPLAGILGGW